MSGFFCWMGNPRIMEGGLPLRPLRLGMGTPYELPSGYD